MTEIIHDFRQPREVSYASGNDTLTIPATGAAGFGEQFNHRTAHLLSDKHELERLCRDLSDALEAVMEDNNSYFPRHIEQRIIDAIKAAEDMGVR